MFLYVLFLNITGQWSFNTVFAVMYHFSVHMQPGTFHMLTSNVGDGTTQAMLKTVEL